MKRNMPNISHVKRMAVDRLNRKHVRQPSGAVQARRSAVGQDGERGVLIKRTYGGVGDILNHLWLINAVADHYKGKPIDVAIPTPLHPYIAYHPLVRQTLDNKATRESDYAVVIDTSDVCVNHENDRKPFVHKQRAEIWAEGAKVPFDPERHAKTRISPSAINTTNAKYRLGLINVTGPYILFQPFGMEDSKSLPPERARTMAQLIEREMGVPVVTIDIKNKLSGMPRRIGLLEAKTWLGLINGASHIVTVDTGSYHAAQLLDKPTVAFFAWTHPGAVGKFYTHTVALWRDMNRDGEDWQFCPCWDRGWRCRLQPNGEPKNPLPCMNNWTDEEVKNALDRLKAHDYDDLRNASRPVVDPKEYVKIAVPPGIGDSLWSMAYVEAIKSAYHKKSCIVIQGTDLNRSGKFLSLFDFVDKVVYEDFGIHPHGKPRYLKCGAYNYIPSGKNTIPNADITVITNGQLEQGIRLENILPDYPANLDIGVKNFRFPPHEVEYAEETVASIGDPYALFYFGPKGGNTSSSHNRGAIWKPRDWGRLAHEIRDRLGIEKIAVVGAKYDKDYADECIAHIPREMVHYFVGDLSIAQTYWVGLRSKFFVSFQSGIGIFLTYLGVPGCMWWRAYGDSRETDGFSSFHEDMAHCWAPKWAIDSGQYMPLIYGRQTPEEICSGMIRRNWVDGTWRKEETISRFENGYS